MIKADNATKRFDDITAVDHICAEVQNGSVYGLIGSNGADQSVDRAVLNLRADVIDRRDVVKTLGCVIRFDHLLSSPFCVTHAVSCASSAPSERALPARAVISALTSRSRSSRLSPTSETKFPRPLAA